MSCNRCAYPGCDVCGGPVERIPFVIGTCEFCNREVYSNDTNAYQDNDVTAHGDHLPDDWFEDMGR